MTPSDMPSNKNTPVGSFYSLTSGLVRPFHDSTPLITNEFKLPAKLNKLPRYITDTARKHAEQLKEPVILKDMYIYRLPKNLASD